MTLKATTFNHIRPTRGGLMVPSGPHISSYHKLRITMRNLWYDDISIGWQVTAVVSWPSRRAHYWYRLYTTNVDTECHRQAKASTSFFSFHLIDGLLCTTAVHEVRWAGVLTCGSCHLERSARPHLHRGWSFQVPETALFSQVFNIYRFFLCFSIWLTFVMHLWSMSA